jgi:hypothetical protein
MQHRQIDSDRKAIERVKCRDSLICRQIQQIRAEKQQKGI